jgi:YHS domain-containing protein
MSIQEDLRLRIEELIRESEQRLARRALDRQSAMVPLSQRLERFDALARSWIEQTILPALQTLAQTFANGTPPAVSPGGHQVTVEFARTEEFPVHARVEVAIVHDPDVEHAWVTFSPSIIPILMDCAPPSSVEIPLEAPDPVRLERFLEDKILQVTTDYLKVRDPDSAYQRGSLVTDPVCGMIFRRADAAAAFEHEGRRYFFCVEQCRDRFAAAPQSYLNPVRPTQAVR